MKAIFGRKVGMTRVFSPEGESVPVTVLELGPNTVFQVKTTETDGYNAIQVGYGEQKAQRVDRARTGHFAKAQKGFPKFVKELRTEGAPTLSVGDEIRVEGMFDVGSYVDVSGTSIGKGFAGVMKRHLMKGTQTISRGAHEYFRHGGSIGNRKFPGRVFKNKRMPGHMGVDRRTQERLEVISVRPEENLLLVRGSVPGPKEGIVLVRAAKRAK